MVCRFFRGGTFFFKKGFPPEKGGGGGGGELLKNFPPPPKKISVNYLYIGANFCTLRLFVSAMYRFWFSSTAIPEGVSNLPCSVP